MLMRGIRGATSVENDDPSEIHLVTKDLLTSMTVANNICTEDIASIIFTVTTDIKSCFPAAAARDLGWTEVPLLSATEATVVGKPGKIIRVLMHVNTDKAQKDIQHVYLGRAKILRPDLAKPMD